MRKLIEDLEVKVAFLEDALSKLSDEHYQQQKDLKLLKTQYSILVNRLGQQADNAASEAPHEDDRPPHY